MPPKIYISVDKPGVPSGNVLLEDAGVLASGLHDTLARLIQRQLGFPGRSKLLGEAKLLTKIALSGIGTGSGVMECAVLPIEEVEEGLPGRHPSVVAAFDLVNGINEFSATGTWPSYFPAVARNRIGAALAQVLSGKKDVDSVALAVEDGRSRVTCEIDESVRGALQTPEMFASNTPIEIIGNIFDINIKGSTFKIDAGGKQVTVKVERQMLDEVDTLRWKRVFVMGYPADEACRAIDRVEDLRLASQAEGNGMNLPTELLRGAKSLAYINAAEQAEGLRPLGERWDSYDARKPSNKAIDFALEFLRDSVGVLLDYQIEVPAPFLVPTPAGGVQFEWRVSSRELELEIERPGRFEFLAVDGASEKEGNAIRWYAVRLLRWVITGDEA